MKITMAVIIAALIAAIIQVRVQRAAVHAEELRLREEIARTAASVDTLRSFVMNPDDPEIIEFLARKYGFVYRGEELVPDANADAIPGGGG